MAAVGPLKGTSPSSKKYADIGLWCCFAARALYFVARNVAPAHDQMRPAAVAALACLVLADDAPVRAPSSAEQLLRESFRVAQRIERESALAQSKAYDSMLVDFFAFPRKLDVSASASRPAVEAATTDGELEPPRMEETTTARRPSSAAAKPIKSGGETCVPVLESEPIMVPLGLDLRTSAFVPRRFGVVALNKVREQDDVATRGDEEEETEENTTMEDSSSNEPD